MKNSKIMMTQAEKDQKIAEKYNKKIDQRIDQQKLALDEAEIDLEVAEKLQDSRLIERHQKRVDNINEKIEALESQRE